MSKRNLARIAVFSGSNFGRGEDYRAAAAELGREIARRKMEIVYGGTHKGLMGVVADSALAAGGSVHGVITERLLGKGHLHPGLTSHEVSAHMRARKARMADCADAFVALPGGIGTLEELAEIWTLNQLGDMDKPLGLLDTAGYWRPFMGFIDHMIAEGFLPGAHRGSIVVEADPSRMIEALAAAEAITVPKWM
ncbi:TIGR00730 family Rossman fold protein [Prosthecomicrobium sp. N25]|uniref:LOG family protein n=1 Tax=Prosthecomicrobium sp. N25 TaxID=3129254 RepID=UPI0030782ED6